MQFDSLSFLLFFGLVVAAAAAVRSWSARKSLLLVASYAFYGAWSPAFVLLLAASSLLDWLLARAMSGRRSPTARRTLLVVSLVANLGVLAFFKYAAFLHDTLAWMLLPLGIELPSWRWSLVLPVGISFYTFQSLSYTIDVYRRKVEPIASLRDFCLFVAFFPQLVAGPIVRYETFAPQLASARKPSRAALCSGGVWILWGLFEKVVLADTVFAGPVDSAWEHLSTASATTALVAILGFAGQIFCDFAGYSCCAIGAARCLGFELPRNFMNPYAAIGFRDFWRRWHISLSTWLRDYLYIPLGGGRGGRLATVRNLFITMLLGGLWHGAGWNFVLWGGAHGVLLALERQVVGGRATAGRAAHRLSRLAWGGLTLACVVLLWVPFRAPDAASTGAMLSALGGTWSRPDLGGLLVLATFVLMLAVQWLARDDGIDELLARTPDGLLATVLAALIVLIVLSPGDNHAFIYFQF
ncbi:MAG: MBOAT family protein [Xanthomonadales bacterium]|nr:MBOAT family protein [Xanthomonadales bacterium]